MTVSQTLRVISFLDSRAPSAQTDLSWLAIRQIRALVNAGISVQWHILETPATGLSVMQTQPLVALNAAAIEYMAQHDVRLADLPALVKRTVVQGDADILLAITSPEWWAPLLGNAKRRIAYLERNLHWPQHMLLRLCAMCDEVWLPDAQWGDTILASNVGLELAVIPPIRMHRMSGNIAQDRLQAFQTSLEIPVDSLVFLCVLDNHGMQACSHLLAAWGKAFGERPDVNVSLILHCPPHFVDHTVHGGSVHAADWVDTKMESSKHSGIVLLDQNLNAEGAELLRACSHIQIVTTAGDGLGLRVMDAVEAGNAVVGPATQGLEGLLGPDWQGFSVEGKSPTDALAQALCDAYEHTFDEGPRRTVIQWYAANHLSEAAFVQRVLQRLPTLQVHA
ncbi:glycosyltransferase family 4 protein (plasmid) [Diaphorobacter sp. HDW4B]|uniref:glycosyltransferase n=1 Tax=Diaphorobacter sp. HDW4B TaxID=2714925 RepID=UPI00140A4F1D|nr:glycosyltransferase family 4 protein [Diaphorobacter sp. HDW4B]QIL73829.1 glycosyltransferase family 4 protein [Diaphorobacter sp. HDW4B]